MMKLRDCLLENSSNSSTELDREWWDFQQKAMELLGQYEALSELIELQP